MRTAIFAAFLLATSATSFTVVPKVASAPKTQLNINKSSNDNVVGFFTAAALSLAILTHPTPAFADGKSHFPTLTFLNQTVSKKKTLTNRSNKGFQISSN